MSLIQQPPTICYVAAKSGGHIMPALTLAHHEKSRDASTRILFISSSCHLDKKILDNAAVVDRSLTLPLYAAPTTQGWFSYFHLAISLVASFFKSLIYFWQEKPTHLVSMGGLISVPVCFAAMVLRIPFDMWELNVVPGKAVSALKYFARTIYICFSSCNDSLRSANTLVAPYPVRFDTAIDSRKARIHLNIPSDKKVLMVLGGSQGSSFMNHALADMLIEILNDEWFIIHQTGQNDYELVNNNYKQTGIPNLVFNFTKDLAPYYAAADLIIARAGAGTIFEIVSFKKRAILIPLHASTTDHQVDNACAIVNEYRDYFYYIEQASIDAKELKEIIENLCSHELKPK